MSKQHARYSPSKLQSKEKCPRFDYQQEEPGDVNEAAEEGTLLHEAYETGDMTGLNEEQKAQVEKVLQFTETLTAGLDPGEYTVFNEIKLEVPGLTFGYGDRIICIKDKSDGSRYSEAHVVDAKFGRKGADEANNNVQIMCYSGGLLFGLAYLDDKSDPVKLNIPVVHGHIVAPRLDLVTSTTYTAEDEPRILGRIEKILEQAANPFSQPKPDPDLCTLCQWRASCPAVNSLVVKTAEAQDLIPSIVDPTQLEFASPEDKSKAYALAQILAAWSDSARKVITQAVLNGEDIPNYQRMKRAASAKITSTSEAIAMLQGSVPEHVIHEASTISITKLVNAYSEHTGETKKSTKEFVEDILAPVIDRGPDIVFLQRKRGVSEKDILSSVPQLNTGPAVPQPD